MTVVECSWTGAYCPEKTTVPPGVLLADAVRAAGWKHVREPGGKSKNYCPAHKPK